MTELPRMLITAGSFLIGSILLASITRCVLRWLIARLNTRTKTKLDELAFYTLESPLILALFALGTYGATLTILRSDVLTLPRETLAAYVSTANSIYQAIFTLIIAYGGLKVLNVAARFYATTIGTVGSLNQIELPRKLVNIGVWAVALVLVLSQLGYEISPLLATLGIGGLAVALALQDTLSNIFAGFYVMADKTVKVGDYVKLDSGEEGFVEEVSWRNTRIRLWANNMVIIPNSKLIQSVITNYNLPEDKLSVYISCGVSYSSNLDHVEEVTKEVGRKIIDEVPGSVKDFDPVVRFKEFADSNINFVVVLRASDVGSQYLLHHEFMKALHRRFREEGIEINYPMRVIIPANDSRESMPA